MNAQQHSETPATATSPASDEEQAAQPLDLADVVADGVDEEYAGFEETPAGEVPADDGAAAVPAVEQPGVDGGAAGEEPVVEDDPIEPPVEGEDGKWRSGKYVADTLPELFVQVEKGRRNAEKLAHRKQQEATGNPFRPAGEGDDGLVEEFDEELEVFDEADFGASIGTGVAQTLMQMGLVQAPQVDPNIAAAQATAVARQAVNDPNATGADFEAALTALMTHNPFDQQTREQLLEAWGTIQPYQAARTALEIEHAFAEITREQQAAQAAEQQQAQQQQLTAEEQAVKDAADIEAQAYTDATTSWVERNPDWVAGSDLDKAMNEWMQSHPAAMRRAKGDPEAIYDIYEAAKQYGLLKLATGAGGAPAASVAGIVGGAPEQGATMTSVTGAQTPDPNALRRAAVAELRDSAGMELGVTDDVEVTVLSATNPAGIAEQSTEDLLGMQATQ